MSSLQTTGAVAGVKSKFYDASGSFTVPAGVNEIYITAVSGGPYINADTVQRVGYTIIKKPLSVTPGDVLTVTIGAAATVSGSIGGHTSVGAVSTSSSVVNGGKSGPGPLGPFGMSVGALSQSGAALIEW